MITYNELTLKLKLSSNDKKDLDELVNRLPETDKQDLFELLNESPNMAKTILDNFRKKKDTFINQDKSAWKKILEEEKQMVNQFAAS